MISVGMVTKNACGQPRRHGKQNCNQCAANKLGCSIRNICVAKQKRAKGLGVKAGKEPKQARVEDGEVESGSDDTEFARFDMGARVTQDLSVML